MKRLRAMIAVLAAVAIAASCSSATPEIDSAPDDDMKARYVEAAGNCLEWIEKQMLTFDGGAWGVYERIRISKNERVSLCRPDTASEYLLAVHLYRKATGKEVYAREFDNVLGWLEKARNGSESGEKGGFPFAYIGGKKQYSGSDITLYQNDNGKIISNLIEIYRDTRDERLLGLACASGEFWLSSQRDDGSFIDGERVNGDAHSPFSVLWMMRAMYDLYDVTGDERYFAAAEKAFALAQTFIENGRVKTAYELERCENWRPVSSENYIALLAFCASGLVSGDERLKKAGDRVSDFCLSLIDKNTGGVLNCTPETRDASESNNPYILDLVYTEGFALNGLYYAYRALENKTFLIKAKNLGDFLCSIQIKNTSPLIDGAWRGMYDLKTGAYGGSIHESSSAEEGGSDSVYAGWCSLVNAAGLLRLATL